MSVIPGLAPSFHHARNGMIRRDMVACELVARELDEVLVFRSTGPWSRRWIERGHPTKNFHVKGKSSDWGPQAGFVPFDGLFSKKASTEDRTKANLKSEAEGWARAVPLVLTAQELDIQLRDREGDEVAIRRREVLASGHVLLWAGPHPDTPAAHRDFLFRAVPATRGGSTYTIYVYLDPASGAVDPLPDVKLYAGNKFRLVDAVPGAPGVRLEPLRVMASSEVGAGDRPITGDYDLFAVVPRLAQYGSQSAAPIAKPGIQLQGQAQARPGMAFAAGVGMDNVPDPSLHTGVAPGRPVGPRTQPLTQALAEGGRGRAEHADMGNVTPRVLRAINRLNAAMGATGANAAGRRVHHNAENLRPAVFGALTEELMCDRSKGGGGYGDGFPLTAFLPLDPRLAGVYGTTCTITDYPSLKQFVAALHAADFYVQRNAAWNIASPLRAGVTPEFKSQLGQTLLRRR